MTGKRILYSEMKNLVILFSIILYVLAPAIAQADAGLSMLALLWPLSWIAFIPVVIIEAWIAKRILDLTWKQSFIKTGIANAYSTIVGIPLTWVSLVFIQLTLLPGGGGGVRTYHPFRKNIYGC